MSTPTGLARPPRRHRWARGTWLGRRLPSVGGLVLVALVAVVPPAAATARWWPPVGAPTSVPQVVHPFLAPAGPYAPGHRGVDLAAPGGALVRAPAPGAVAFAGRVAGRGVVSVLHAGGLRTTYEPVRASVHRGDRLRQGQLLGTIEDVAGHCGDRPCLHWGAITAAGQYVDPMTLLLPRHVVLLPLGGGSAVGALGGAAGAPRADALPARQARRAALVVASGLALLSAAALPSAGTRSAPTGYRRWLSRRSR